MKTKSFILLSVCAVITLSFTFASVKRTSAPKIKEQATQTHAEKQVGGLASEDKLM